MGLVQRHVRKGGKVIMAIRDLIPWSRQESRVPERTGESADQHHPLLSLHRDVNRLFDDVFRGFGVPALGGWGRSLEWPSVELAETDNEIRVTAELPGMDEKGVDISVHEHVLSIRGEKRSETEDKDRGYSERSYGRFERHIGLPRGVEEDRASATFKNGVLTIVLPKSAAAIESRRSIPINAG
jgi:HSP20 family protein